MGKTGLVLSGGGAKGAYQVGVMKALRELNIPIDMLAGASIGALNGGILASAPNLYVGTERLEQVWTRLGEINPIQMREWTELLIPVINQLAPYATYLTFLSSAGLTTKISAGLIGSVYKNIHTHDLPSNILQKIVSHFKFESDTEFKSLCNDHVLHEMMDEFLDIQQLQNSMPFYVSVYEYEGFLKTLADIGQAELFGIENKGSIFKHLQSLPISQQREMLLASAAIPVLFETRQDENGKMLTDGGQGGWLSSQGNTPVTPLIEAGCNLVIITHLSNGALWHKYHFPHATCIEIRPNPKLNLGVAAMFDFSAEKIQLLIQTGYEDTIQQMGNIYETLDCLSRKRQVNQQVEKMINQRKQAENLLDQSISRLK